MNASRPQLVLGPCEPVSDLDHPSHRVVVVAQPGVLALDVGAAGHIFASSFDYADRYRVQVCGVSAGTIETAEGYSLQIGRDLCALNEADTVIVAGTAEPPTAIDARLVHALRASFSHGARIIGIGTGVFTLAMAGVLAGRQVTTHWRHAEQFKRTFPTVHCNPEVLYVQDQTLFTSAGFAAAIDLFVELIRQDHGVEVANAAARSTVMAPPRRGDYPQVVDRPLPTRADSGLADVRAWMVENLREQMTVDTLAARAFMSRRQFTRTFRAETGTSAWQWLLEVRLREARRLLESSDEPVELIGQVCGFPTAASFRMHFRRATAHSPSAYRAMVRNEAMRAESSEEARPQLSLVR